MSTITLVCHICQTKFDRETKEYNRNKKENQKCFCSRTCSATYNNSVRPEDFGMKQYRKQKKTFDIKDFCGNNKDDYSSFKYFINKCKDRAKKGKKFGIYDIDLEYLKSLWDKQNGICPYTGIKMILPPTTNYTKTYSLKRASLDRIDSSIGYLKGNVEFVCLAINLAKCACDKEDVISFIKEIKGDAS